MALHGDEEIDSILAMMGSNSPNTQSLKLKSSLKSPPAPDLDVQPSDKAEKRFKKATKKKKRKRDKEHLNGETSVDGKNHVDSNNPPSHHSFIESRLSQDVFEWPSCLFLGPGLAHDCNCYVTQGSHDVMDQGDGSTQYGSSLCTSCSKSAASHELCITSSPDNEKDITDPSADIYLEALASVIVAARNARCLMGEYFPSLKTQAKEKIKSGSQNKTHLDLLLAQSNAISSSSGEISSSIDKFLGKVLAGIKKMVDTVQHESAVSRDGRHHKDKHRQNRKIDLLSELGLLRDKSSSLVNAAMEFKKVVSNLSSGHSSKPNISTAINIVEARLVAMASCDAIYYRCYYTIVTFCISHSKLNGSEVTSALIPHPPTYFCCPGLAWDADDAGVSALRVFLGDLNKSTNGTQRNRVGQQVGEPSQFAYLAAPIDEKTKKLLLQSWGLGCRLDSSPENLKPPLVGGKKNRVNPLLALWQSRFLESLRHIWANGYSYAISPKAIKESSNANLTGAGQNDMLDEELRKHETRAISSAVALWRNSVRDYPANFYAYAAPTDEALNAILEHAVNSQLDKTNWEKSFGHIIEAGAGTGYWASLLNENANSLGIQSPLVVPYDISPPSTHSSDEKEVADNSSNQYHGQIPTFTRVLKSQSFDHALEKESLKSEPSLFLCYPPPNSEMAHSALSSHISSGGQIVAHVGEWQGLTGDASFENLITKKFVCKDNCVIRLPLWGTDATYLTIWERRKVEGGNSSSSIESNTASPSIGNCSVCHCHNKAKRRCRFARSLQYCSNSCFQGHNSQRRAALALHMVHLSLNDDLDYGNDDHFLDVLIDCTPFQRQHKKRKKRKR